MYVAARPTGKLSWAHSNLIISGRPRFYTSSIKAASASTSASKEMADVLQPPAVQKAPSDTRSYQALRLRNGASFVVVQDTEVVFAAAAVNVQAGYMDDPASVPGLAHFLEHMVHLGTDKYPEEQQYKAYLAQYGGSSNASTGMVHTVYHFTVHHNTLEGALDRLAQFFVSPLLLSESAGREVENVHAEFSRNCNSDARKILQLRRSLCRGPYSQFSTGNLTTLKDTPAAQGICVSQLLRHFWEQHYTADRICGCVVGPQPLEQLAAWVTAAFEDIRPAHPSTKLHSADPLLTSTLANGQHVLAAVQGSTQHALMDTNLSFTEKLLSTAPDSSDTEACMEPVPLVSDSDAARQGNLTETLQLQPREVVAKQADNSKGVMASHASAQVMDGDGNGRHSMIHASRSRYTLDMARPNVELGCLVRVSPQREAMRTFELNWHIPYSPMQHMRCKPWRWVGHLLGHEGPGSLAAALKHAGLVTELQSGTGDELKLQPGFMFWGLTLQLTEEGLAHVPQIIAAVHAALAVLLAMPEHARRAIYDEAAQVALLRWSYADRCQAVDLARDLAYRSHYWDASHVLSGPVLMQEWDGGAVQQFLQQLRPSQLIVVLAAQDAAGPDAATEQWYGAKYTLEVLPEVLVSACAAALHSPPCPAASPNQTDPLTIPCISLHPAPKQDLGTGNQSACVPSSSATPVLSPAQQEAQRTPSAGHAMRSSSTCGSDAGDAGSGLQLLPLYAPAPNWALPVDTTIKPAAGSALTADQRRPTCPTPQLVVDTPAIRMWHLQDIASSLPKAHIYLNLITPCVYTSPDAWITARLLVRLLDDLLQSHIYDAELLGTTYSLSCNETGFNLHLQGFSSVLPQLLQHVLEGINQLAQDTEHVANRHHIMAGKLVQQLQVWAHNNPVTHAEYAAEHVLQVPHWHVNDTLAALQPPIATTSSSTGSSDQQGSGKYRHEVSAAAVSQLAATFKQQLFIEGLCYGNLVEADAVAVSEMLQQLLQPAGLPRPEQWPCLSVIKLQPPSSATMQSSAAAEAAVLVGAEALPAGQAAAQSMLQSQQQEASSEAVQSDADAASGCGVEVWYTPVNPNPKNTNSALLYVSQVCDEQATTDHAASITAAACLELLVQMASKRCFHALRTTQRLGYIVSLSMHKLHGVLSLQVRIQSPDHAPNVLRQRLQQWLVAYRQELAGTTDEQLAGFKASLHSRLQEPPRSLSEAASRCWHPIRNRTYTFDRRLQKMAALQRIMLPELLSFYDAHIMPITDSAQHLQSNAACSDASNGIPQSMSRTLCCEVWGSKVAHAGPAEQQASQCSHVVPLSDNSLEAFQRSMARYTAWPCIHRSAL